METTNYDQQMFFFKLEEHWLTLIYVLSHVRLLINRKWKERQAMTGSSRNRYYTGICRCWSIVVKSESSVLLSLLPKLTCPSSILAFHDMAAYELAGSSINLAILHKLKRHQILRICTFWCWDAERTGCRSGGRSSLAYILSLSLHITKSQSVQLSRPTLRPRLLSLAWATTQNFTLLDPTVYIL